MWWSVATLTTVGYGDVYPITLGGKIFGAMVSILGVGLVALPTGVLGAGLIGSLGAAQGKEGCCPYCGHEKGTKEPAKDEYKNAA